MEEQPAYRNYSRKRFNRGETGKEEEEDEKKKKQSLRRESREEDTHQGGPRVVASR